jgi:hypothetical protein
MRKSRVLLVGVAVAGAAVTTSAFTAGNTFSPGVQNTIAGFGTLTVTGAVITDVDYIRDVTDETIMASVVFDTSTDLEDLPASAASITLKNGVTLVDNYDCLIAGTAPAMTITCTVGDVTFEQFDTVGLAVGGE